MFESTVTAANRWSPTADPACEDDGYTELDLDQWAAELWAERVLAHREGLPVRCCDVRCEQGCVGPDDDRPDREARGDGTQPPPGSRAGDSRPLPTIAPGTAYIASQVTELTGPELATFLASLPPLAGLDGWCVIEAMKGYEKVARWAAAGQATAVAEIAHRYPDPRAGWARDAEPPIGPTGQPIPPAAEHVSGPVFDQATTQVALALELPRSTAQGLVVDAVSLTTRVPRVLDRLRQGQVSARVAHVLAQETMVCADAETAAAVADHVLDRPGVRTGAQARRAVADAVIQAEPAAAERRERAAMAGRAFRPVKDTTDGMVTWEVTLPVAQSLAIDSRLTRLAQVAKKPGDRRARAAVRADLAVAALLGQPLVDSDGTVLAPANLPTTTVWRTDVVVPLDTVAGGRRPGFVPGWGPVTGATARHLATGAVEPADGERGPANQLAYTLEGDSQWRRLVTDPLSGTVLDYGTTRYRPPAPLDRFVRARDARCYEPGCSIPAAECDLDHIKPSPAGPSPNPDPDGATAAWNLGAGCRTSHRVKAMPGWSVTSPSAGTFVWTTPTGHTYTRQLEPALSPPLPPIQRRPPSSRPPAVAPDDYGPPPY